MQKLKKKIMSCLCAILSLCMIVSMSMVVYADDGYRTTADKTLTVTDEDTSTEFTVTIPVGTVFVGKESITNDDELYNEKLTLKVEQYTNSTSGFHFAEHRNLINQHMQWHTGLTNDSSTGSQQSSYNSTNDAQFWRIWFEDEDGNEVNIQLPANGRATVVVEYKDPDFALKGEAGTCRTCVMNMEEPNIGVPEEQFVNTDDFALKTSESASDIGKIEKTETIEGSEGTSEIKITYYTKITYYIDGDENGISAWGNLIALCAMKLPKAYMSGLTVDIADGSAPFDDDDEPGNDSSANNKKVRTFDSIIYSLGHSAAMRTATGTLDEYIAVLEGELDLDITEARFDTEHLSGVFTGDEDWYIEYKDAGGNNLYIENKSGLFKCNSNGKITSTKVSVNDIVGSSSRDNGVGAYRSKIVSQRVVAYRKITDSESKAVPSTKDVKITINVYACKNKDTIVPRFKMYVKGNKDNYASEQDSNNNYIVSQPSTANTVEADEVMVSAASRYNLVLKRNQDASYASYFNFETGQETTSNDEDAVYGRILSYGITLQLFNEGTGEEATLAEKGLRGLELPIDDLTFQLTLTGSDGLAEDDKKHENGIDDYSVILWDYALNIEGTKTGIWGRNIYWNNSSATSFAKGAAPYSSGKDRANSVYNSGTYSLKATGEGIGEDGKTTGDITDTGSGVTYSFTVSGFDFDFDNWAFPTQSAGNAGDVGWLKPNYVASFSAGQIQVLQKYVSEPNYDCTPRVTVEIGNMKAKSLSYKNEDDIITKEAEDKGTLGGTGDNSDTINNPVYTPGGISKHNSFGSRTDSKGNAMHGSISNGFLGTDYWESPNFDAYTFAGDEIYLWGGTQLGRSSDAVVSAYNLLQKFDSKVLSIDTSEEIRYTEVNNDSAWPAEGWADGNKEGQLLDAAGDYTILYAADPLNPNGWDSNNTVQMKRMNDAKEDDLIYFNSLEKLEEAGYTCIAVLLEVRNANIPAGCYPGIRVPMIVSTDTENINKTVCTVNTARMWIKPRGEAKDILTEKISWENGSKNNLSKDDAESLNEFKNTIVNDDGEDIYTKYWDESNTTKVNENIKHDFDIENASYLRSGYNNCNYAKTEYSNNVQVPGTHDGYQQGMSLLVIGYESKISIGVENTNHESGGNIAGGNVVFEVGQGEWNPLYTIKGIQTILTDPSGSASTKETTNLVITASVQDNKGEDLIKMAATSLNVVSDSNFKLIGENVDEEGNIEISEDENKPTTIQFVRLDSDGEVITDDDGKEITYEYKIYASRQGDVNVVYHLLGVPIGIELPNIQFYGQLGVDVVDQTDYTLQVSIRGDGDSRSISSANGNIAPISVRVTRLSGTALEKKVDKTFIEQNDSFTYSVSYTNSASETMDRKFYLYDLLPYNGDIRGSNYEGGSNSDENDPDTLTVTSVSGKVTGGDSSVTDLTVARVYYSTLPGYVLREYVEFDKGTDSTGKDIDNLIRNALIGNDANGIWYVINASNANAITSRGSISEDEIVPIYKYENENNPDIVTGINTTAVEYNSSELYGEVKVKDGYLFYNPRKNITATNKEEVPNSTTDATTEKIKLQCYKMFRWFDSMQPGNDNNSLTPGDSNLTHATALYAVVENLGANKTLTMSVTLQSSENKVNDVYGNIAHSWKQGDNREKLILKSNMVQTRVISRQLSGLVWIDTNKNGIRDWVDLDEDGIHGEDDKDEELLSDVTCTLFKFDEDTQQYEEVKVDEGANGHTITANGETIDSDDGVVQMTTGKDGKYSFENLADGDYVVAFSGIAKYYDVTTYQVNETNDSNTNDGVANINNSAYKGIDSSYEYCIKYSSKNEKIHMHSLEEMMKDSSVLTNGVEMIENQDLGLIARDELPETGGQGTRIYTIIGFILISLCIPALMVINKRKKKEEVTI